MEIKMLNSNHLLDLHPIFRPKAIQFISDFETQTKIKLLITSTKRDFEAQHALYERGRTKEGSIVTNADAGHSAHNYGLAMDAYPLIYGKPLFLTHDAEGRLLWEWDIYGTIARKHNLEWAGDWKGHLIEYPHIQYLGGLKISDLLAGKFPQA
jgi:peptidoglycan L-alanyl-D-glutamate endopeptidase CwlK